MKPVSWQTFGTRTFDTHVWHTRLTHIWHAFGTHLVHIWHTFGTCLAHVWHTFGTDADHRNERRRQGERQRASGNLLILAGTDMVQDPVSAVASDHLGRVSVEIDQDDFASCERAIADARHGGGSVMQLSDISAQLRIENSSRECQLVCVMPITRLTQKQCQTQQGSGKTTNSAKLHSSTHKASVPAQNTPQSSANLGANASPHLS